MSKIIIFGNSGSGKSTLAKALCDRYGAAHLDLDTIAWASGSGSPPMRNSLESCRQSLSEFMQLYQDWVIEGCYGDLVEMVVPDAEEMIFLNLPVPLCITNATTRPWEPHKYPSKAAQDKNLAMLTEWIKQYPLREDDCSLKAHEALYKAFPGKKVMHRSNDRLDDEC